MDAKIIEKDVSSYHNEPHEPQLVIYDLDGTLFDTIDDLGPADNHAIEQKGFPKTKSIV